MFTGIIQAVGTVRSIRTGSSGARLALNAPGLVRPIPLGSSVCINGVCLTAATADDNNLEFDIVPETLSRSTLGALTGGSRVNLERALRGDPLDGHMVQGHVDGTARVQTIGTEKGGHLISFRADAELMPYIIPKGSIAIDGVSLTIATVDGTDFAVALIPTTLAGTTLQMLRPGDCVNIETDILARTIVTTLRRWHINADRAPLSIEALRENGW